MKDGKLVLSIFFLMFIFAIGLISIKMNINRLTERPSEYRTILSNIAYSDDFVQISGSTLKGIKSKMYYMSEGIYVTSDENTVNIYPESKCEYELNQMAYLKSQLDPYGINLIYVNVPSKYIDDKYTYNEFGIRSYANKNADTLVEGLKFEGIETLDLRDVFLEKGIEPEKAFYKTEHHWTAETGLTVADILAEELYDYAGFPEYLDVLNNVEYFYYDTLEGAYLGEQGVKLSKAYVEKENITIVSPRFEMDYHFRNGNEVYTGTFDDMLINYSVQTGGQYGYYTYLGPNINDFEISNDYIDNGKVTILGDSMTNVVAPFLSIEIGDVEILNPRQMTKYGVDYIDKILESGCDTLVVMYSQAAIGAHDRGDISNSDMFSFEK